MLQTTFQIFKATIFRQLINDVESHSLADPRGLAFREVRPAACDKWRGELSRFFLIASCNIEALSDVAFLLLVFRFAWIINRVTKQYTLLLEPANHVKRTRLAHHKIISAVIDRVPVIDNDPAATFMIAGQAQTTDHTPTM